MSDFESRINALDVSLFGGIPSETYPADKQSLLALQNAVRQRTGPNGYSYLEIGSHLGGTIQPHLCDPQCRHIYSIDPRPDSQPDERGDEFDYPENSTARMLELLADVDRDGLSKITCFDSDASEVDDESIDPRPDLCFIDGEHTNRAVQSDFAFCHRICKSGAVIAFHDAHVVYRAILGIAKGATREGACTVKLGGVIYAIELGGPGALEHPCVKPLIRNQFTFFMTSRMLAFYQKRVGERGKAALRPLGRLFQRYQGGTDGKP